MVRKILLVSTIGNITRKVWRLQMLMLGCKGLMKYCQPRAGRSNFFALLCFYVANKDALPKTLNLNQ